MCKSNFTLDEWLESTSRKFTPWGDQVSVRRVKHTDEVCITGEGEIQSRGKHEPRFMFVMSCDHTNRYKMYDSSILYCHQDGVVYVCAEDKVIEASKATIIQKLREQSAHADLNVFKEFLTECWRQRDHIFWQCQGKYIRFDEDDEYPPCQEAVDSIRMALQTGHWCEGWLSRMPVDLSDAIRHQLMLADDDRLVFFNDSWREYKSLRIQKLCAHGLTEGEANELVRMFKPAMAMRIAIWAENAHRAVKNPRALFAVLTKAINNDLNREWVTGELVKLSVPLPRAKADGAFMCMIRGARKVLSGSNYRPADLTTKKVNQDHMQNTAA